MKNLFIGVLCVMMLFASKTAWAAGTVVAAKSPEVRAALGLLNPPTPENIGKTRSLLNAALKKNPKDVEAHMALVDLALTEYRISPQAGTTGLQDALRHADAALKINRNLEDAHRKKSLLLFLTGKKEEGHKGLKAALKKWPASPQMHEAYLAYLLNLGKVREAEAFSSLKNSRVKNRKEMLIRLGHVWQQAGYPDQALECYEHSLHHGETAEAWAGVGRSNLLRKDCTQAVEFFQKALIIDAVHYAVYNDLAFCYHQTGQSREAIRWMEAYTKAFPDDLTALGNLAGLYEGTGEKVKARLAWMKIEATTRDTQQASLAEERLEKLKAK